MTEKSIARKNKSIEKLKELGIAYLDTLPTIEDSSEVTLRSLDEICQRAIACLLSTQIACDISENNDYNESKQLFSSLLKNYGVENNLLYKEKKLFAGSYQEQDVIDIVWTYETYWALIWALGLIDNIEYPTTICDCQKAITIVGDCQSYDEFKSKCHLRDIEEILDMLDLHYRYHWACVEKSINPETSIGKLNSDVVIERRRGLEWLISQKQDWNDIQLNT